MSDATPRTLIVLDPDDSVGVSTSILMPGEVVRTPAGAEYEVLTRVQRGHKLALRDHGAGDPVIKYGARIGVASTKIRAGEHVHSHNLVTVRGRRRTPRGSDLSE